MLRHHHQCRAPQSLSNSAPLSVCLLGKQSTLLDGWKGVRWMINFHSEARPHCYHQPHLLAHRPQFSACHTRGTNRATSSTSLAMAHHGSTSPLLPRPHPAQQLALLPVHPVADLPGGLGLAVLGLLGRAWRGAAPASILPPTCLPSAGGCSQV